MGHELALKLLLVGIKVLNQSKIIKYILYFKTVSFHNMYLMCPLLPSNSKIQTPLWESVIVLCFVVRYFMSILVLQSS